MRPRPCCASKRATVHTTCVDTHGLDAAGREATPPRQPHDRPVLHCRRTAGGHARRPPRRHHPQPPRGLEPRLPRRQRGRSRRRAEPAPRPRGGRISTASGRSMSRRARRPPQLVAPRCARSSCRSAPCWAASASPFPADRRSRPPPQPSIGGNMDYRGFTGGCAPSICRWRSKARSSTWATATRCKEPGKSWARALKFRATSPSAWTCATTRRRADHAGRRRVYIHGRQRSPAQSGAPARHHRDGTLAGGSLRSRRRQRLRR